MMAHYTLPEAGMRYWMGVIAAVVLGLAGWRTAMAQESETDAGAAAASFKYIYLSCNNLPDMRAFYTDLLGMPETVYYYEDGKGWLCYQCGTLEVMFFPSGYALPVLEDWGMQPGWPGGVLEGISWSVEVPGARFAEVVAALKAAGVPTFAEWPLWCQDSYWSFPVRDPMGNTVEVYTVPKERPASTEWPQE